MCGPLLLSGGYNSNFVILFLNNIVLSFLFRHYKITVVKFTVLHRECVKVSSLHPLNRLNPDNCCSQLYLFMKLSQVPCALKSDAKGFWSNVHMGLVGSENVLCWILKLCRYAFNYSKVSVVLTLWRFFLGTGMLLMGDWLCDTTSTVSLWSIIGLQLNCHRMPAVRMLASPPHSFINAIHTTKPLLSIKYWLITRFNCPEYVNTLYFL